MKNPKICQPKHQPIFNFMGQIFCTSGITIDLTIVHIYRPSAQLATFKAWSLTFFYDYSTALHLQIDCKYTMIKFGRSEKGTKFEKNLPLSI